MGGDFVPMRVDAGELTPCPICRSKHASLTAFFHGALCDRVPVHSHVHVVALGRSSFNGVDPGACYRRDRAREPMIVHSSARSGMEANAMMQMEPAGLVPTPLPNISLRTVETCSDSTF